ncbi:MAG: aldo/keto reductase [Actinomycetota bacterium]|nr:aldo/keto reductase [Actinomycetota bacterium]
MQYVSLEGRRVPALGLGTWELEGATCRKAVATALELGYRHIDTAQGYGNEADVGAGIDGSDREELFLTTKLGTSNLSTQRVHSSTRESLDKLGTDYVDLLLIHWPAAFERVDETLSAMVELREAGAIRHIGVSNFTSAQLVEAARLAPVACNQVEYHPFLGQQAVLAAAREHDMVVAAYSPLARGAVMDDDTVNDIAAAHAATPGQVALAWLLAQDGVMAIPKASSREHLQENLAAVDLRLTDEELGRLDDLERGQRIIDPPSAPEWD